MFSFKELSHDPIILRLFFSLIVLLIMLIARRFLSKWIIHTLARIKFHKVHLEISAFNGLKSPINYFILTTGIYIALAVSPFVFYTNSAEQSFYLGDFKLTLSLIPLAFLTKLYLATIAGIVTWFIYELECLYEHFFTELNEQLSLIDNTVFIRYLSRIINFITIIVGCSIVLIFLVPDFSGLLTGVGIGGAAVAFVAKDSLASMISGMFLLLDKPFSISDWVSIDDLEGIVEDISFRSTRIRTFSQGLVIIPNNTISNANIINWSRMKKRRVSFDLGVSYNTTPEQLNICTNQIRAILSQFEDIEKETYIVHFTDFGDYSLNIRIIYYTLPTQFAQYLAVQEAVNLKILEFCESNNIEIAFPTQTILMPQPTAH